MGSLHTFDVAVFRFINGGLSNAWFDAVLPFFSSNGFFVPALLILGIWLIWNGGLRGRLLVVFLLTTLIIGDPIIVNSLKKWIDRPRPFAGLTEIHLLVGTGTSKSMPSGHAANWFAALVVAFTFYRRSLSFMLPLALIIAFSRVYLGAHYPSDVLAGTLLGMGYAALILWGSQMVWRTAGRRWFPLWWAALPSLLDPPAHPGHWAVCRLPRKDGEDAASQSLPGGAQGETRMGSLAEEAGRAVPCPPASTWRKPRAWLISLGGAHGGTRPTLASAEEGSAGAVTLDQHWLRLSYLFIAALLFGHLIYLSLGRIELSEDEAYQWLWSKHLALSYFSKPPLIAYTQFLGTKLWGDSEFGVRFFSPVLAAIGSFLLARFLAREANGRVACWVVLIATATPLLMVGATLMTIDALSVFFWVAALVSGWQAVRQDSTRAWVWTGLWMGLGFLSKYVALFQWLCWAVFFAIHPPARKQLRRPGPYLALLVNALCTLPVLIWNARHDWITVGHLADRGGLDQAWQPTLKFFWDFLLAEAGLLNPVFFVGAIWAAVAVWKHRRQEALLAYLFSMGVPLFLVYLLYTFRARVQPNWIAPAVLPLFCLMLIHWERRWREGVGAVRHWLLAGMTVGLVVVVPLHDAKLVAKIIPVSFPAEKHPLTRVLGWEETARVAGQLRTALLAEGKPVFIIGDHYGIASLMSFYLPEAKREVRGEPLVYVESSDHPKNQFYFWPGYENRRGQNAIFVKRVRRELIPIPAKLQSEFRSVTDLGVREVQLKGQVLHRVQLFACRDLR